MARIPPLPFVRSGVSQGWSANQAYRHYQSTAQDAGVQGVRRQDFLRLYSETIALRGLAAEAIDMPKDQLPTRIEPRGTRRATGYGHWVAIYQRTSGSSDLLLQPFLVKSREPLTPAEAEARAREYLDKEPERYNRVTLGVGYLGTEQFVPDQYGP